MLTSRIICDLSPASSLRKEIVLWSPFANRGHDLQVLCVIVKFAKCVCIFFTDVIRERPVMNCAFANRRIWKPSGKNRIERCDITGNTRKFLLLRPRVVQLLSNHLNIDLKFEGNIYEINLSLNKNKLKQNYIVYYFYIISS